MLNRRDMIKALLLMLVFLTTVSVSCYYIDKDNNEKELMIPFKMLKGDATYEMRCLDGYAYIIYKERSNVSISQMMIDNGYNTRPRLAHCKED